jgi:hypothetical protein
VSQTTAALSTLRLSDSQLALQGSGGAGGSPPGPRETDGREGEHSVGDCVPEQQEGADRDTDFYRIVQPVIVHHNPHTLCDSAEIRQIIPSPWSGYKRQECALAPPFFCSQINAALSSRLFVSLSPSLHSPSLPLSRMLGTQRFTTAPRTATTSSVNISSPNKPIL